MAFGQAGQAKIFERALEEEARAEESAGPVCSSDSLAVKHRPPISLVVPDLEAGIYVFASIKKDPEGVGGSGAILRTAKSGHGWAKPSHRG